MLVRLFEPVGAPWSLDGIPKNFSFGTLPRLGSRRTVSRHGAGADSIALRRRRAVVLLRPGVVHLRRPPAARACPGAGRLLRRRGMNSLGILMGGGIGNVMAHWIVDGVPPVDVTGYAIDRVARHESSRRFRSERTVEQLGVLFGDAVWPTWKPAPPGTCGARCP